MFDACYPYVVALAATFMRDLKKMIKKCESGWILRDHKYIHNHKSRTRGAADGGKLGKK